MRLPLKLAGGPHELLLSSKHDPTSCTLRLQEVDEQPMNELGPHVVASSPGEPAKAYSLRFPEDVLVTTEQTGGIRASLGCDPNGSNWVVPNLPDRNRLVAVVPAGTGCTLWLIGNGEAGGSTGNEEIHLGLQSLSAPVTSRGT